MTVNCPLKQNQRDALVCVYRCPMRIKIRCKEYFEQFEKIKLIEVEEKYKEKYGEPDYALPNAMRKRRKRRTKWQMEIDRAKAEANAN